MYRSEIEFEGGNGECCLDWTLYDLVVIEIWLEMFM